MPSDERSVLLASIGLAVLTVVYFVVVGQQLLFGVFLASLVYLFGWVVSHFPGTVSQPFGKRRAVGTGLVVAVVLGYSVLIATQLLFGVVVALTVGFVSWATIPGGPVARWLADR